MPYGLWLRVATHTYIYIYIYIYIYMLACCRRPIADQRALQSMVCEGASTPARRHQAPLTVKRLSRKNKDRDWRMCKLEEERESTFRHPCPETFMHVTANAVHVLMPS